MFYSPTEINENTKKLIALTKSPHTPVILRIQPGEFKEYGNCFFNVADKVKKDGGSVCYGWAILHDMMIYDAEAHAVWRNSSGEFVDITPRNSSFCGETIMFVPDDRMVFTN